MVKCTFDLTLAMPMSYQKNPNSPTCLFANSDIAIELLDSGYTSYPYVAKL
jgi:hypothetical protein